ncbi:MAG: TonB-dependent receptor plug domain-containing protein [Bacteroidales bacterium]|jgi:vitamin B12 transporter|nr:TonB-dependent receptor plug domain-containing protein [Bacteroidales bacterium]
MKIYIVLQEIILIKIIVLVLYVSTVQAQGIDPDATQDRSSSLDTITVEAPRPDWESKLSPGTVTVVRPDERAGEQKNLADLLREVAGVYVREVNGRGHYTTVSIRGSSSSQVGIFVDGVLNNSGADAAVDISTIPIKNVERIEVYRGYIPVRFGGTFIGGVINIVTKKPRKTDIQASIGKSSFGGAQASFQLERPLGSGAILVGINYDGSKGNFQYINRDAARHYKISALGVEAVFDRIINGFTSNWTGYNLGNVFCTNYSANQVFNDLCSTYLPQVTPPSNASVDAKLQYTIEYWRVLESQEFYNFLTGLYGSNVDSALYSIKSGAQLNDYNEKAEEMKQFEDAKRRRLYNSYKNMDGIIKWQNDNITYKFTWKDIDRNIPTTLHPRGGNFQYVDGPFWHITNVESRQQIQSKDFFLGWRSHMANLEWGISANYSTQVKRYREFPHPSVQGEYMYKSYPFRLWSRYESNRFGVQLDGEYKLGNRNLIEFLANFSKENLEVYGNGFRDGEIPTPYVTLRPSFEQRLINVQLQDTLTLDSNNSFFLTGSLKYNSSRVFGKRPIKPSIPMNNTDITQTDSKFTWQVALKKTFKDIFTLRATYGTYYRLLNLYEIVGDGAGIMPQPNTDRNNLGQPIFPMPEEGKQFDMSAILNSELLGANANIALTYFRRSSKKMLHLTALSWKYMSYTNAREGKVYGFELEASMVWDKFDIYVSGTRQDIKVKSRNDCYGCDKQVSDKHLPYMPEKQAYARINWHPFERLSLFSELNYTGQMYTVEYNNSMQTMEALTTVGFGAKATLPYGIELVVGVRDFFNKEPNQRILYQPGDDGSGVPWGDMNVDYPRQGRTIYATLSFAY